MDEFSLAHGAGDFGEGVEGWIEEVRVVGGEFVFPGFDAESAVELLLEGAELVPGAVRSARFFIVCWKTKPVRRRMAKW